VVLAPEDWSYHCFPLVSDETTVISLNTVAEVGLQLVRESTVSGDHTEIGMPIHWAHRFVNSQSDVGDWPDEVDAKTGEVISGRSRELPCMFLKELGDLLQSSEFDHAVELAEAPHP